MDSTVEGLVISKFGDFKEIKATDDKKEKKIDKFEEANLLLDKYGAPPGLLEERITWTLTDIESRVTPVIVSIDPSWKPTASKEEEVCTVEYPPRWNCLVCGKKIHAVYEKCTCSEHREKDFHKANLCTHCCEIYDKLMADEGLKAVVKQMFRTYYLEGNGSIKDF